jgi:hypothetical protein
MYTFEIIICPRGDILEASFRQIIGPYFHFIFVSPPISSMDMLFCRKLSFPLLGIKNF